MLYVYCLVHIIMLHFSFYIISPFRYSFHNWSFSALLSGSWCVVVFPDAKGTFCQWCLCRVVHTAPGYWHWIGGHAFFWRLSTCVTTLGSLRVFLSLRTPFLSIPTLFCCSLLGWLQVNLVCGSCATFNQVKLLVPSWLALSPSTLSQSC